MPTGLADGSTALSRYVTFTHEEWGRLRAATPLTLTEADLVALRGINEKLSLDEVVEIYLPLSRLLNLYVAAAQNLHRVADTFLGILAAKVPYVIGVGGSVDIGGSAAPGADHPAGRVRDDGHRLGGPAIDTQQQLAHDNSRSGRCARWAAAISS